MKYVIFLVLALVLLAILAFLVLFYGRSSRDQKRAESAWGQAPAGPGDLQPQAPADTGQRWASVPDGPEAPAAPAPMPATPAPIPPAAMPAAAVPVPAVEAMSPAGPAAAAEDQPWTPPAQERSWTPPAPPSPAGFPVDDFADEEDDFVDQPWAPSERGSGAGTASASSDELWGPPAPQASTAADAVAGSDEPAESAQSPGPGQSAEPGEPARAAEPATLVAPYNPDEFVPRSAPVTPPVEDQRWAPALDHSGADGATAAETTWETTAAPAASLSETELSERLAAAADYRDEVFAPSPSPAPAAAVGEQVAEVVPEAGPEHETAAEPAAEQVAEPPAEQVAEVEQRWEPTAWEPEPEHETAAEPGGAMEPGPAAEVEPGWEPSAWEPTAWEPEQQHEPAAEVVAVVEPEPEPSSPPARRISSIEEIRDGGYGVGSAAPFADRAQPLGHPVQAYLDTMTYRDEDTPGYDSREPDLWFYDDATAERCGFTRAQEA